MTDIDRDGKVSYNELLRQNFKKNYILYSSLDAVKITLAGPRLAETVQKEQNVVTCPHLNFLTMSRRSNAAKHQDCQKDVCS